jgi:hypothetical protein
LGQENPMTTPLNLLRGLAVLVALSLPCFAVNAQEQQAISGIGAQRCAILTARVTTGTNPNDTAALLTWIEGFISGLNMNAENDFYYDLTSIAGLLVVHRHFYEHFSRISAKMVDAAEWGLRTMITVVRRWFVPSDKLEEFTERWRTGGAARDNSVPVGTNATSPLSNVNIQYGRTQSEDFRLRAFVLTKRP